MATFEELYGLNKPRTGFDNDAYNASLLSSDVNNNSRFVREGDMFRFYDHRNAKQGVFSSNNPFLSQLSTTVNDSDLASIFEMATKWEADRANLVEQREYDSPLAQLQRQKVAGINSELSGGSSVGGNSSSSMPASQSDIRMGNPMDEAQMDALKHQTVLGFVNGAVSLASGVIGGISQLAFLPSQIKVSTANAAIAEETKDVQVAQALAHKQTLDHSNIASSIANLGQVSQMFTPDTTDEEMSDVLTSFGYSPQNITPTIGAIRHYQKNPNLQALFAEGEKKKIDTEAYNSVYLPEVVSRMYGVQQQVDDNRLDLEMFSTNIKASVASLFDNEDTVNKVFNIESNKLDLSLAQTKFDKNVLNYKNRDLTLKRTKLERDIYAWSKQLERNRYAIRQIESLERSIFSKGDTPDTRAIADALKMKRFQLMTLSSQNFSEVVSILNDAKRTWYRSNALLNSDGKFNYVDKYFDTTANTIDMTFNDDIMNSELSPTDMSNYFMNALDIIF